MQNKFLKPKKNILTSQHGEDVEGRHGPDVMQGECADEILTKPFATRRLIARHKTVTSSANKIHLIVLEL